MNKIIKITRKHASPLRYPGGKTGLSTFLSKLILENNICDYTYVEPYAGGAGAALKLLFENRVSSIIINDFDRAIYSFWKSAVFQSEKFIDKIESTEVTIEEWNNQKEIYLNKRSNQFDLGFATFYLNRTNRSGIIEGGPIGGIKQKGKWLINARWN